MGIETEMRKVTLTRDHLFGDRILRAFLETGTTGDKVLASISNAYYVQVPCVVMCAPGAYKNKSGVIITVGFEAAIGRSGYQVDVVVFQDGASNFGIFEPYPYAMGRRHGKSARPRKAAKKPVVEHKQLAAAQKR